jgi:hypothetical protein
MGTCKIHKDCNEVVILDCMDCDKRKKVVADHSLTDAALVRAHFRGWTAKGAFGAKRTRCPNCRATLK